MSPSIDPEFICTWTDKADDGDGMFQLVSKLLIQCAKHAELDNGWTLQYEADGKLIATRGDVAGHIFWKGDLPTNALRLPTFGLLFKTPQAGSALKTLRALRMSVSVLESFINADLDMPALETLTVLTWDNAWMARHAPQIQVDGQARLIALNLKDLYFEMVVPRISEPEADIEGNQDVDEWSARMRTWILECGFPILCDWQSGSIVINESRIPGVRIALTWDEEQDEHRRLSLVVDFEERLRDEISKKNLKGILSRVAFTVHTFPI